MRVPEMGLIRELMFFGLAVLRGMLILVIYDGIRIFRRVLPHGVWSVALGMCCTGFCLQYLFFS